MLRRGIEADLLTINLTPCVPRRQAADRARLGPQIITPRLMKDEVSVGEPSALRNSADFRGAEVTVTSPPIRSDVRTDGPAVRAHHPWPERRDRKITRQVINVHDPLVPALVALDVERAHAVRPHVREVHRLDRIVEAGAGHHHHTAFRARIMAGLSGFLTLIQSREGPERYGAESASTQCLPSPCGRRGRTARRHLRWCAP